MINHDDIEDVNDGGRLPWEEVWTPDIVLYNAAGDGEQGREMRTLIQVNNELWIERVLLLILIIVRLTTKEM